jgi:phosphate/sulfate permease
MRRARRETGKKIRYAWLLTFPVCFALGWCLSKLFGLFLTGPVAS